MPMYMDIHEVQGATPEAVAPELHAAGRGLERLDVCRVTLHDQAYLVERPAGGVDDDLTG